MTEKNMWNLSPQEALKACQASEQGLTTTGRKDPSGKRGKCTLRGKKEKCFSGLFRPV